MAKHKYIADYIYDNEIGCKCRICSKLDKPVLPPMGVDQLVFWQKISNARHIRGIPITFVSGYRCEQHRLTVLNSDSAHYMFLAADFFERGIIYPLIKMHHNLC